MARNEPPPFHAAGLLDFTTGDIAARRGWLTHLSRRHLQNGARLMELAALAAAGYAAARAAPGPAAPASLIWPAALITAAHAAFLKSGLYGIDSLIEPARALRPLTACWTLIFLAAAALPFPITGHSLPAAWLLAFYAAGLTALVITRWSLEPFLQSWVAHGHCTRSIAIVGANAAASRLIRRLRHNRHGIRVAGVFDDRAGPSPTRILPLNRLGTVADLAASTAPLDLVVITLPLSESARIAAIIAQLRGKPYKLRLLPGPIGLDILSPFLLPRAELPGIQLIEVK